MDNCKDRDVAIGKEIVKYLSHIVFGVHGTLCGSCGCFAQGYIFLGHRKVDLSLGSYIGTVQLVSMDRLATLGIQPTSIPCRSKE
jgi:hypothetical protein